MRLDQVLVSRGLCESRAKAREAIEGGHVSVNGRPVLRPAFRVPDDAALEARAAYPWVSRGGLKLVAALDAFAIDPAGRTCLDVGASTGGFSDVLLSRGAAQVFAVDVGRDQLHARLRADPRVQELSGTDIRGLAPGHLPTAPSLIVCDASFISLALVLPPALRLGAPTCSLVALIKPQFEVGPGGTRKGLVRDAALRASVCDRIAALVGSLGWSVLGVQPSPITGGDGNQEYLIGASRP